MSLADQIRMFVLVNYIKPARTNSKRVVYVVSRDIVKKLNLYGRVPAVCGAIDARKFLSDNRIQLKQRTGPKQGLTAAWQFVV
jgi:5-methylcytosine-specific restriction enzyme B